MLLTSDYILTEGADRYRVRSGYRYRRRRHHESRTANRILDIKSGMLEPSCAPRSTSAFTPEVTRHEMRDMRAHTGGALAVRRWGATPAGVLRGCADLSLVSRLSSVVAVTGGCGDCGTLDNDALPIHAPRRRSICGESQRDSHNLRRGVSAHTHALIMTRDDTDTVRSTTRNASYHTA